MRNRTRVTRVLLLSVLIVPQLVATSMFAGEARKGFSKATVARVPFGILPNASAPPSMPADDLIDGLDAKILEQYDDVTLVEVAETDKQTLKGRGDEQSVLVTIRDDFDRIFLNGFALDTRDGQNAPPPGEKHDPPYARDEEGSWLIQFMGPIKDAWMEEVKSFGAALVQYLPMHGYILGARESTIKKIETLPYVQWTLQMHRFLKPSVGQREEPSIELWIELAQTSETKDAVEVLRRMGEAEIEVAQWSDTEVRVQGVFAVSDVDVILGQPLVIGIAEKPSIRLSDERSAFGVTNIVPSVGSPAPQAGKYKKWLSDLCSACTNLQGDGFYIGIADTGLDGGDRVASGSLSGEQGSTNLHRDELASSRVAWGASFELTTGDWSTCGAGGSCPDTTNSKHDVIGHGTLVAGIAAGNPPSNGSKDSDGYYWGLGVAPSAGLAITKINSKNIGSGATPLLTATRDARTSINPRAYWQNFSLNQYFNTFGSSQCSNLYEGAYSLLSRDFDGAVRDADSQASGNQSITLTTSSGNVDQNFPASGWSPGTGACTGLDRTLESSARERVS